MIEQLVAEGGRQSGFDRHIPQGVGGEIQAFDGVLFSHQYRAVIGIGQVMRTVSMMIGEGPGIKRQPVLAESLEKTLRMADGGDRMNDGPGKIAEGAPLPGMTLTVMTTLTHSLLSSLALSAKREKRSVLARRRVSDAR